MDISGVPSEKRPGEPGDDGDPPRKLSKTTNSADDDFSTSVRKKLSNSSRTGQACDRCKVRKIKCDGNPAGCSPCQQAQHICKTTDRNNGRTTVRGHADRLEWENRDLQNRLAHLERRLRAHGIPIEDAPPQQLWDTAAAGANQGHPYGAQYPEDEDGAASASVPNPSLSILKGTTLELFGMQIDVAKFTRAHDDPESPTGRETFLKYTFGKAHVDTVPALPPTLEEAQDMAVMYLKSLNPFTPILHKPDLFPALTRLYEGRRVTAAEEVIIHMFFGEMKYQFALRNQQRQLMDQAYAHYKYSLGFYHELLLSRKIPDLQALLLIAVKQRNFPKPGAAWECAQLVLSLAIELDLHRSANSLPEEERESLTYHQKEMRKRIFWIAYTLSISLSWKLGLPIRLKTEDTDIEFPDPEPDDLLDEPDSCSFQVGIAAIRILEITSRMINSLFTPRRSHRRYANEMPKFENEILEWRKSLRPDLRDPSLASREGKVQALFIHFWQIEALFFLRHPVIHSSSDPKLNAENSRIILDLASDMLGVVMEMRMLNCIDVPWINCTVYLAAVFTTLFIHEQNSEEISSAELRKLEADMGRWLIVLQAIGKILGTGDSLAESTRFVVDKTLERIRRRVSASTAAAVAQTLGHSPNHLDQQSSATASTYTSYQASNAPPANSSTSKVEGGPGQFVPPSPSTPNGIATAQGTYPNTGQASQYQYADPSVNSAQAFQSAQPYTQPRYSIAEGAQVPTAIQAQTAEPTPAAGSTVYSVPNAHYYSTQGPTSPVNEWVRWGQSNFQAFPPHVTQEYANSASALVALGGRSVPAQDAIQNSISLTGDGAGQSGLWPMNFLNLGQQQNGSGGV